MTKVKSTHKIKSVSKQNPILKHRLQNAPVPTRTQKKQETHHNALTIKEHGKAVQHYLKYYEKGITVKTALDKSQKVDIIRARTQLRAFYIRSFRKNIFTFTVKASGLYEETSHQVELSWDMTKADMKQEAKEIFLHTPMKAQCSCGRFTYWYRYIWTKANSCLGLQEHRFPSIRNKNLDGMACKHTIKVLQSIHSTAFQNTFNRYLENHKQDKQTRLSFQDKTKIAGSSFGLR